MEYNKCQFSKINDKKILHKIGRHWVSISLSTLMALGGIAAGQQVISAHAAPVNNNGNHSSVSMQLGSKSSANATLQTSSSNSQTTSSAASFSNNSRDVTQAASQLHSRIINNSLHNTLNQSSNSDSKTLNSVRRGDPILIAGPTHAQSDQMKELQPKMVGALNKSNSSSTVNNNAITVDYFNQHNQLVGHGVIPSNKVNTKVDVISPNDHGIAIPNGYTLDSNQDPNLVFNGTPQVVPLTVHGNEVDTSINIKRIKKYLNGKITSDTQSLPIKGIVGNTVDIQPRDATPANITPSDGFYIDRADHSVEATVHPADTQHSMAYLTPGAVTYTYDESKKMPVNLGQVLIRYQDVNSPGVDISRIPVRGQIGNSVDLKEYQTNVPNSYYYVRTAQSASKFTAQPQSVIIMVHQLFYVKGKLFFENVQNNNSIVAVHDLLARKRGYHIDFQSLAYNYMPKDYHLVGFDKNNPSILHTGDKDIIYVAPGSPQVPKTNGAITIRYDYQGKTVYSIPLSKPVGTYFSMSHYLDHCPDPNYKVTNQVLDGQNVQQFLGTPQFIDLGVVPINNQPIKPQQDTITIDYRDSANPSNVLKTASDQGTDGSPVDFTKFKQSSEMPNGYVFDKLGTNNATFVNNATYNIFVKKPNPNQATIYIDYRNFENQSSVLKTVSDTGKVGSHIDYSKYEKAPYLPTNYSFLTLGNSGSVFENGAHENILVSANSTPSDHPSDKKTVSGTLIYKDNLTGNPVGQSVTISGTQDSAIDYAKYTNNGSQYMPTGYHFDKIADDSGQYLEPGATYIVMVNKNKSDQPQNVKGTMYYIDNNSGKSVGTAPIKGTAGEVIPYSKYESSDIPTGYHFDRVSPDSGTKLESGGSYTIIVDKDVQQITDNVVYKNVSDGSSVGTAKITGQQDQAANLANYEDDNSANMPSGFHFDHADPSNPAKLLPNTNYVIYVKKSSKPVSDVTAYVVFHNTKNDSDMQVMSDTAKPGTVINYNDYINRFKANHTLPNGYYDIQLSNNAGQTVQSNARNIVNVTPMTNGNPNQKYTAHIIFRNTQNNDTMQTISDTDKPGTTIDYQNYINQFVASHPYPNGHYNVAEANGDDSVIPNRDANEIVNVTPVANSIQNVTAYIVFHNTKTNQDMQTMSDTAKPGTMINYNDYINRFKAGHTIPNGYYDAQLSNNASQTVQSGARNVVDVTPMTNGNPNQKYTARIIFRNTQNNDQMQTISDTAKPGSTIDYQNYINQFLANHQYPNGHYNVVEANGDDSSMPNYNANEIINVTPVKDTISGTLYYRNGNQTLKNVPISGIKGTPVNYNQFEQSNEIPNGYHVAGLGKNASTTFEPNGNYVIMLKANPNVSGTIFYFDAANGAQAGTAPISGPQGGIINFQPYEANNSQYMPKGYHFDKVSPGTGNVLEPGRGYSILVDKNAQQITDNVIYRDVSNGNQLSTAPISGLAGSAVNLVGYEANSSLAMPSGYQFDYVDPKNQSTLQPNTNYTIFVKKSTPQMIQGTLNYVDPLNHQVVKSTPISGAEGSTVDYGNYMNQLPSGYKLAGISSTSNQKFEPNGNYTVLVEPVNNNNNNNNQPQTVNGTLNYKDNDGNTIKSVPISGTKGSNVNYDYYMQANQMPQGYHLVGLGNGTSATFEPNGSYSIVVAANPANNTPSNPTNHNSSDNNGDNDNGSNGDNTDNNGNGDNTNNNGNNSNGSNNSGNSGNTDNGNSGSGNSGSSNTGYNNGNGSNQPIFTDRNSTSSNGSNQNNGSLPKTGEHHNYDRQISEILIMMGISLASLGRCIRRRYDN